MNTNDRIEIRPHSYIAKQMHFRRGLLLDQKNGCARILLDGDTHDTFVVKDHIQIVHETTLIADRKSITAEPDNVNHPKHYTSGEIECIDAIKAALSPEEFRGFLKGNVIKYAWRERLKGGIESLKKANWYLARLVGEA